MSLKDVEQLDACGLVSPEEFEREMDMGNYIGFKDGAYDILNDRFMPKGRVPLNVLVSMCTNYAYGLCSSRRRAVPRDCRIAAGAPENSG
jgi:hypothetical protein